MKLVRCFFTLVLVIDLTPKHSLFLISLQCFKLTRNSKNQSAIVLFVEVPTVEKLAISLVLNTLSVNRPY